MLPFAVVDAIAAALVAAIAAAVAPVIVFGGAAVAAAAAAFAGAADAAAAVAQGEGEEEAWGVTGKGEAPGGPPGDADDAEAERTLMVALAAVALQRSNPRVYVFQLLGPILCRLRQPVQHPSVLLILLR